MLGHRSRGRWRSWISAALVGVLTFTGFVIIVAVVKRDRPAQVLPVSVLTGDWAPYVGTDLPKGGALAEFMTSALQNAGYDPQFTFTTWSAVDERTSNGSAFGGFPLVASADREHRMLVSEPLLDFDYVLFVRSDFDHAPVSAAELSTLRVGGIDGYDYWPEFDEAASSIERYDTTLEGFAALDRGEIDVFAEGEASAAAALADPEFDLDASAFETVPGTEPWARSTQQLFFMMQRSSENERALEAIDQAIREMKQTSEYRAMLVTFESNGSGGEQVVLTGSAAPLVALRNQAGTVIAHTPQGVSARVLSWPDDLTGITAPDDSAAARVKLTNGPHAGHIFWVPVSELEVTE